MQLKRLFIKICCAAILLSCRQNTTNNKFGKAKQTVAKDKFVNQPSNEKGTFAKHSSSKKDFAKIKSQSLVISCGSGCALTYNVKDINQLNATAIKVAFDVEMYVDEEQTENFEETYIFNYNANHKIEKIIREGENENVLDNLIGGAQQTFKEFAAELIK